VLQGRAFPLLANSAALLASPGVLLVVDRPLKANRDAL